MANLFAQNNANYDSTNMWSTTPIGAIYQTPAPGDVLMANNKTVNVNVSFTVAEIRNDTTGGATAGGYFTFTVANTTITANVYSGSTGSQAVLNSLNGSGNTQTITGNLTATGVHALAISGTSKTIINGNIVGGTSTNARGIDFSSAAVLNINGNCTAGTATGAYGVYQYGAGSSSVIVGNIIGAASGAAFAYGISSNATLTGTGTITGPTAAGNGYGLYDNSTGAVVWNGNIYGSTGSAAGLGLISGIAVNVTINGDVIAGTGFNAWAINNGTSAGGASIIINGKAISNDYPNNSITNYTVAINGASTTAPVFVNGTKTGTGGVPPIANNRYFINASNINTSEIYGSNAGTKYTLTESGDIGDYPATSNVRYGTAYNFGSKTGTLVVPTSSQVSKDIVFDNGTIGTALLTEQDIKKAARKLVAL